MVKKHMGIGNENGLLTLFEQRKPVYERALRVVNVEKLPSNEVVEQILEIL
jgi:shikimate kinase